jgi:uncharacterized OB-fold protein
LAIKCDYTRCAFDLDCTISIMATTKPRHTTTKIYSQSNDRSLPVRCQACGTILPADSIRCVQCGQIHNEQGLAELRERCKVFE